MKFNHVAFTALALCYPFRALPQGYIVPNGVVYAGTFSGLLGYGVSVIHDPTNSYYTGFAFDPTGKTPSSTTYTNTFQFSAFVDVSVRVFAVSANQPVSLTGIAGYPELSYPNQYIFNAGSPFFLALYTGNQDFAPPNGIYSDPLFGWVELVNNGGVIEMLDGAIVYKAAGIYAGTPDIIQVPEPSTAVLFAVASLAVGWRLYRRTR